ncbi:MAG: tRNA epoxyqueuosine(34) reductase QueG, partial [Kiritimatiellia bacterium]|nr:tRNA epoxyqueuosine(34) reductase QueG [Kiritimatiellia bacterium]
MIPNRFLERGAEDCGLIWMAARPAGPAPTADRFSAWLRAGRQGGLGWMLRSEAARADPRLYRPGAETVVLVGVSYATEDPPNEYWNDLQRGRIARFAWGPDYHNVLDARLKEFSDFLGRSHPGVRTLARFTDSRPILERAWAAASGEGFIGKNTQFILPARGSFVLLGGLLLDTKAESSPRTEERAGDPCGDCAECLRACPGEALIAPRELDVAHCLSYWTIEHKTAIPAAVAARMSRWVFGCDECQQVCPFILGRNRNSGTSFLKFEPDRDAPLLTELFDLDPDGFLERYAGTSV